MKSFLASFLVLLFVLTAIIPMQAQYNQVNLKLDQQTPQNKYRFEKLQLYPIRANQAFEEYHKDVSSYVILKEALEKKKVAITEYNGRSGGEVNTLYIENISKDTIMVLSGEVVQGGKQDRVIAQDFVLYPHSGKKDISVFCVEHGRWQQKEDGMAFNNYFSISSNEVRKAATVSKDQQTVWMKVAETTDKNKASTSTGTLAALQRSGSFNDELKKYMTHFGKIIGQENDVIGVVAVSGDQILGCDMFASHNLFNKHYTNLLNSYATEAITSGKEVTVSYDRVQKYLQSIIADESKQDNEVYKKGTMLKDGNRKIHISTF